MAKNIYTYSGKSRYNEKDREILKEKGLTHFYELRTNELNVRETFIVKRAFFNNEGCLATNFEIKLNEDGWTTLDKVMAKYKPIEIQVDGVD